MSNAKYADRAVYKVLIKAPIETVWSELVDTKKPRPFFWNSSWDTPGFKAGAPYRMLSKDKKVVAVIGEILEMDPPRRMTTSFRLTAHDDAASRVIYTLKETPEGVEFCLITENIPAGSKSEKSMADGAKFIVENFKAYVETGKVTFGAQMMLGMMELMSPMVPKALKAENWPLRTA
ncbi:MAG: SRPBCC domain-containing protein [Parvularculaceae bacterium]|jgi:uncharacterized protein YndB with AHSA1/START domain|nr:SRPBCC domain-containing protein [Parvularculaceae bacterium]